MLKTAKVVGFNSDTEAALAQVFPGASSSLVFAAVIFAACDDAFARSRQALSQAAEGFYLSTSPLGERLQEVFKQLMEVYKDAEEIELLLGALQEDEGGTVFYLLHRGQKVKAVLFRDQATTDLCTLGENGELVSGMIEEGDRIVLSTQSLEEVLEEKDQRGLPLENIEDEVVGRLSEEHFSPLAAAILQKERPVEESLEKDLLAAPPVSKSPFRPGNIFVYGSRLFAKFIPRSKKATLYLGVVFLLVILAVLGLTYKKQKDAEAASRFEARLHQAQTLYSQAQSLKDLDPGGAETSLTQANSALAEALKIRPKDSQALGLKYELEGSSGEIMKNFAVSNIPLWLDLELIKKGFSSQHLSLSHGKLLILDSQQKVLLVVDLANKSPQILGGEEKLGQAKTSSLNGNMAWVLSEDKGLVQVDIDNPQAKVVIKADDEWGQIADIYGFAGNIYLLDKNNPSTGSGQIWKYLPIATGYSDKREYLQ
ncbi:MAG: hypothetical protein Q7S44_02205, partial [bacterium]|nr:hypothetical protein [bacterium]